MSSTFMPLKRSSQKEETVLIVVTSTVEQVRLLDTEAFPIEEGKSWVSQLQFGVAKDSKRLEQKG